MNRLFVFSFPFCIAVIWVANMAIASENLEIDPLLARELGQIEPSNQLEAPTGTNSQDNSAIEAKVHGNESELLSSTNTPAISPLPEKPSESAETPKVGDTIKVILPDGSSVLCRVERVSEDPPPPLERTQWVQRGNRWVRVSRKGRAHLALPQFSITNSQSAVRLQINGGAGSDASFFGNAELSSPIFKYLDASLRFSYAQGEEKFVHQGRRRNSYYTYSWWYGYRRHYYYSYYQYETKEDSTFYGGDAFLLFNPCRGKMITPYAGLGLGYASTECSDEKDDGASLVLRAGIALNYRRLTLKGEYIKHDKTSEVVGDVGLRVSRRLGIHAVADKFDFEDSKSFTMFGGGLSWDF